MAEQEKKGSCADEKRTTDMISSFTSTEEDHRDCGDWKSYDLSTLNAFLDNA
jgi:hypothetical protein